MPEEKLNSQLLAKYTSNPMSANPIMDAEQSRFDAEAGFSINPYPNYGSENIDVLNESRAQAQSTLDRVGLIVPRIANKFLAEVAKIPGYTQGLVEAMGDKTIGEAMDNAWLNNVDAFSENFNEEFLKVYVPEAVAKGGLFKNLSSASFYATEGADAVGFLTSMIVPGNVLKLVGVGNKLARLAAMGAGRLGKTAKIGNTLQKTALWAGKNYDDVQAAFVNTMLESGAEAKESFDNTLAEQVGRFLEANPGMSEEDITPGIMKQFRETAGEASSNVFKGNTMLLFASNLIDQANIFGAFGTKKNIMSNMYDQGRMLPMEQVLKNVKANYKSIGKAVGSGFLKEGFGEEGTQFSMGEFYKSEALGDDKYESILDTYIDNLDNTDLQKSIFLGGFLGGGMSVVGEINEAKRTKETLVGSEDIKRNKFQKALGLSDRKGSIGVYQSLKEGLIERNNSILNSLEKDDKGKPILNNEKVKELFNNLNGKLTLTQMMDVAALMGDKEQYDTLKNVSDLNYFLPFFQQGEAGLALLQEHITNELSQIEAKKAETGDKLGLGTDPKQTATELIKKSKDLFKLYQGNSEMHKYDFPKLKGGTPEDFAEFSENIQYKKLEKALFDYSNSESVKDLTGKLATLDTTTAEGKKEAEFLEKKIKIISDAQTENQADYNSYFDKKALQTTYEEYLKGKKETKVAEQVAKENNIPVTDEDFDNEYLRRLIEAGYDVEDNVRSIERKPIYFVNKGKAYVAKGKPGDKSRTIFDAQTGQAVGTFNAAFYKGNRETIKFVSPEAADNARKKRKLFERKQKQLQALNEVATTTREQYNTIIDEIDAKLAERETLVEKLKQDQKTLAEALDSRGRAKKGMKDIRDFILKSINTLDKQIQQLDSEIDSLESAKQDLDSKKFAIEEYKTELEQLSDDEVFSFKKELEELELFEESDTRKSQLLVVDKILSDINSIISRTEETLLELGIQREAIQKLVDVYKGINATNEINLLASLKDRKSEAYKNLIKKYPFLERYNVRQFGLLPKIQKDKVKAFATFEEYVLNKEAKKQLNKDLQEFIATNNMLFEQGMGIPDSDVGTAMLSEQDVLEDIRVSLENVEFIDKDIQGLENHIADVEELKKEYTLNKEELDRLDSEISKLERFLNRQLTDKQRLEETSGSIASSRKKLDGLRQLVNDVTVAINKQMVTKGAVTASNTAPLDQEPPVEETVEAIKFRNSAISNLLLRSIMPEVEYEKGETKLDSQGNPVTSTKRIIQVLSAFMNEFKKELNEGKYRVQFYSPATASDSVKELFKSEEESITDKSIGFVIVDENFNPVQYTLNGVKSNVIGFLPDSISNPNSSNGLRINNRALLAKFVYATTNSFPNMQNLPFDTDGKIAWKPIVDKYGKITMDELLVKAQEWVEPFYQNEVLAPIRESIAKGDTFVKINSVTRGVVLTNKNNDLQSVTKVYGDGKVKIVTIADTGKEEFSGFTPGTVLYEHEGEYYPVDQRTITSDEINTVVYAAYQGWKDASKGNFSSEAPAFGEGKFALFSGLRANAYRWYHNTKSKVSVLSSLIYWGEHNSKTIENPETGKKEKVYSDFKGQIFVRSNMMYFKNPNNNWELTAIPMATIEKAVQSGDIVTNPELKDLITFLSKKKLNVNKELLETDKIFFYPKATFVNGKWEFTYESFTNYQEFLTKGSAKVPKVLGTRAIQKNTANRQLAFDTDITGVPKLFTEKKVPVTPETPKSVTNIVEEMVPETKEYSVDELNNTKINELPDGEYFLKGSSKGIPIERQFVIKDGVMYPGTENSVNDAYIKLNNENGTSYNEKADALENVDTVAPLVKITSYQPAQEEVNIDSETNSEDIVLETTDVIQEIKNKISVLRAKEQAEYAAMSDPNDTVEKNRIYTVYDELITPLINEAEADIEKRSKEEIEKVKERKVGSTFTLGKDVKIIVNGLPSIIKKGETITIKSVAPPGKSKLKGSAAKNAPDTLDYNFDVAGFEGEIINKPGQAVVTHMLSETALIASIDSKYDAELNAVKEVKPATKTNPLADVESTRKALENIKDNAAIGIISSRLSEWTDGKTAEENISEAYHKAKPDNSNPELVQAVEQLLTPQQAPTTDAKAVAENKALEILNRYAEPSDNVTEYQGDEFEGKTSEDEEGPSNSTISKIINALKSLPPVPYNLTSKSIEEFKEKLKNELLDGGLDDMVDEVLSNIDKLVNEQLTSVESKQPETELSKEEKKARFRARIKNNKDSDDQGSNRISTKTSYTKADVEKEKSYLKEKLGMTDSEIEVVAGLISGKAMGRFLADGRILLSDIMEVGTAYHEAFHRIFQLYLTKKEQQDLINEFKSQKNWKDKLLPQYKHLSIERQIEEVIAEEFRDYVLSGGQKIPAKEKSFFEKLIDFVKKMLRLNPATKDEVFSKINSGAYKNKARVYETGVNSDKIVKVANIELTPTETSELINYMNFKFFNKVFNNKSANSNNFFSTKIDVKEIFYGKDGIFESLISNLSVAGEVYLDEDLVDEADRVADVINALEKDFASLVKVFAKNLEYFNVKANFEEEQTDNFSKPSLSEKDNKVELEVLDKQDVLDKLELNTNEDAHRDTLSIMSSVEFNTKDLMPNNIKMLIASLQDVQYNSENKIESKRSKVFGLIQQANWGESVNLLLNNLAGTPADINLLLDKVSELAIKQPRFLRLIDYLGGYSQDFNSNDVNRFLLRTQFVSTFAKTKTNFLLTLLKDNGDFQVIDANSEQIHNRKISEALSNVKQAFSTLGATQFQSNLNEARLTNNYAKMVDVLGIDIKPEDITEAVKKELDNIYPIVSKALVDPGFNINKFDELFQGKDGFKSRLKKIFEEAYKLEDNVELQLVNGEGKSVYSISLNTYQTLIIDQINYWVAKGNSREQRIELLQKNLPHIFNLSTQNSYWLNNVLDTGAKLNYNLSDALKDEDGNGVHVSELKEADLIATTFNNLLRGYYMSMKHSDRSMFPTYSFSNNYAIVKDGDLLTKGASVMINYLKDEVNKVKNLKGSGADLVKYYKEIATDFKRNIFDGIISQKQFMDLVKSKNPDYENASLIKAIRDFLQKKYEADLALFQENLLNQGYSNAKEGVNKKHIGISQDLIKEYGNFDEAVKFASINSFLNHIEETKLFIGDLGQYKDATDIFKRLNMQSSTGNVLAVYDEMNEFISKQNTRDVVTINGEEIVYKDGVADGQIRELVVTDFNVFSAVFDNIEKAILHDLSKRLSPKEAKTQAEFFTSSYRKMVENDGISYANIFSIREFMLRAGEWSIEHGNNFELQLAYLNGDMETVRKLVTVPSKSNPEEYFNKTFQAFTSLKPQYVGPNYLVNKDQYMQLSPEERHNIIAGRKTAYFPLMPLEIQGTILDQMQKFMIKNGIDYIHMTGAAKFGTKQERSFYKTEGNKTTGFFDQEINPDEIGILDYRFMKNQVAINNQPKEYITNSTQGRKNIIEGLYENGLPIDYSGEDWETKSEIHKLATEYQKIQYHLIKSNIDDLLTELDAVKTEDGVSINNVNNFRKLLTKLAEDKNSSENVVDAIADFLVTTKFIELLPNSSKIQNILHSLVTNRVLVEKRPGDMIPQMAVSGSEIGNRIINEKGFLESNKEVLNFYDVKFDEAGNPIEVTPADIKLQLPPSWLPMLFAKYSDKLGVDGNNIMAVVDAFNKDIASGEVVVKVKGLRIPNQQLSSNDVFKVKSFGYPFLQGFALVPSEIVAKTGGDFDIDKISIYWANLDKKTGQPIKYDESKSLEGNSIEAIQNRLLEIEEKLLLHPLQVRNLLSPVADNELKEIAEKYNEKEGVEKNKLSDLFSMKFNMQSTLRFLAGKAGVGQMATWITFNDIAQLNNLELNDTFLDKDGNTLSTLLPDELGVTDKSLGRIYGVDNKSIANALSAILTSQVDLVKDPYAQSINLINQTLNSIAYLLVRGVSLDNVIAFFNQDVIKYYLKMQRLNESNVIKATGRKKIKDGAVVGNNEGMELSKDELISKVLKEYPSPEAVKALQDFLQIIEQTKAMLKVKNYLSPDTKFMKDKNSVKDYLALKAEVKYEDIVKNVDAPLEAGKLLGGFSQGRDLYMDLYKPYYITELEEVRPYLDNFKAMVKQNLIGDKKGKFANKVDDAFISYLLQMYHPELKGKYSDFMKGKKSTAKKVHAIIKNKKHPLHDNILIKNLTVLLNNTKGEDNLKLFKTKLIPFENNLMIDAFNEIAELDPFLAKDLIIYNIFQSGIAPSPYQLQKIFPHIQNLNFQQKDLLQEVENIVNNIKNWDEVMSRFTHAFLASNMEYNPTSSQKYSKNYKPYPYYKQWNPSTKSYNLIYNGKVFSPIGDVKGIDYSIDFPYSNVKIAEKEVDTKNVEQSGKREYTPEIITTLKPNEVFVFGSNTEGKHGLGAAKLAKDKFGAIYGKSKGLQGQSYAIVTKDLAKGKQSVTLDSIYQQVIDLNDAAKIKSDLKFYVTKFGTELAGFKIEDMKQIWQDIQDNYIIADNIILPKEFEVREKNDSRYSAELQQEMNDYYKMLPENKKAEFVEKINNFVNENGGLIDTKEKEEKLRDIICKF